MRRLQSTVMETADACATLTVYHYGNSGRVCGANSLPLWKQRTRVRRLQSTVMETADACAALTVYRYGNSVCDAYSLPLWKQQARAQRLQSTVMETADARAAARATLTSITFIISDAFCFVSSFFEYASL